MTNTYCLQVRTACPVTDGETDLYAVTIQSESMIQVEAILAFFAKYTDQKIFQEDLTRRAATALGARVETVGIHSSVTVRSSAP